MAQDGQEEVSEGLRPDKMETETKESERWEMSETVMEAVLPETYYVTRSDVMDFFGLGRRKFESLVDNGVLTKVFLGKDEDGFPTGHAVFRRSEVVENLMEE